MKFSSLVCVGGNCHVSAFSLLASRIQCFTRSPLFFWDSQTTRKIAKQLLLHLISFHKLVSLLILTSLGYCSIHIGCMHSSMYWYDIQQGFHFFAITRLPPSANLTYPLIPSPSFSPHFFCAALAWIFFLDMILRSFVHTQFVLALISLSPFRLHTLSLNVLAARPTLSAVVFHLLILLSKCYAVLHRKEGKKMCVSFSHTREAIVGILVVVGR